MLDKVAPNIRELDEHRLGANALAALNSLRQEDRERLELLLESISAEADSIPPAEEEPSRQAPMNARISAEFNEIFRGDTHAIRSFAEGLQKAMAGPSRTTIVHNSFLVMAVSAFEVLISGLVTRYFIAYPGALATGEREFSLDDVGGFKSEEDALDLLLSRRVGDLMAGGLDGWSRWFKDNCKADLPGLAINWDVTQEIFQRRHVVTHSGGLVSSRYLAKVQLPDGVAAPTLGSRLTVDDSYLAIAFDHLDALGTAIGVLAWGSWLPAQRDESAGDLLHRTYQTMLLGRWQVTEKLATLSDRITCSEELRHSIRCNGWLSEAERVGYDSIAVAVENWDVSALSGRFKLVRLVLLQRTDDALAIVPKLLRADEISPGELREWPILRTLREHPNYEALVKSEGI